MQYIPYLSFVVLFYLMYRYFILRIRFLHAELQSEINQKEQLLEKIRKLATRDELTGLPNRRLSLQLLQRELMRSARTQHMIALIYVDIDNFKMINENSGHEVGDSILREFGSIFSQVIRANDLAGRIGADQFLVVISDLKTTENVQVVAEKIISQIKELKLKDFPDITLSAHAGVLTLVANTTTTSENLLSTARAVMHKARDTDGESYVLQEQVEGVN